MRNSLKPGLLALALLAMSLPPALAQAAGANQSIFEDERQMMRDNNVEAQQYQQQEQIYERQVNAQNQADEPYRLYAMKRILQLKKYKAANGSPALSMAREKQMYALEQWLQQDAQTRAQEQAHIQQLDKAIANLQQSQGATMSNLGNDINGMRENQEAKAEDDRFNKMMQMNYFNELQSEMGAASWGRPPTDGTYNSVGGYGFLGGYGYSMGGGRRF